ncbi:NUDIX domain-containing protein [Nonomuraea soli]|uniref:8-oxo-dGTP pyrophosphatase MutT (NUDIX family) n=1 Tax=Nonomuraea soli TaxID=1032476 RepID=A0A7W0CG11_9ACTN|nr:NUDIX hydrolase [Nonomuraea soli]MBA2890475.1 8-oxo-dGTP pyrophosphatase MutT (NUDIX family) [Nonomuraea soli]
MRPSVRGVLFDSDDRLIIFKRIVPERDVYYTVPGGHVEPSDASLEATLHREMMEELGAVVGQVVPLVRLTYPWRGRTKTQHIYGCRLVSMDPALRHGPEFDDPSRGVYEVVRLEPRPEEITSRHIVPEALGSYLAEHIRSLPALVTRGGPPSPTGDR